MVCKRPLTQAGVGTIREVRAFADAGVTWWMLNSSPAQLKIDKVKELIRLGPPRL
ncbi:MAG: hypothetical protein AAF639_43200 [Chloroflexota bacterium]